MLSKEDLLRSIEKFVRLNGRYPTKYDCWETEYLHSPSTYRLKLGSYLDSGILEKCYADNPSKCQFCEKPIEFENRNRKKFCNQSCAASFNNPRKPSRARSKINKYPVKVEKYTTYRLIKTEKTNCIQCFNEITGKYQYCSSECHAERRFQERICKWLLEQSTAQSNKTIRGQLAYIRGYKCEVCGISEWNGEKITLEVDHVDGNSENSSPKNLRLICPNCHSQTPTYKGRNKGNGRFSRWQRYQEGKSY